MRGVLLSLALAFVVAAAAPTKAVASPTNLPSLTFASASTSGSLQAPDKPINIDVTVNRQGGRMWYRSPVWIAIGAVAAVVVLLMIVLIARGGGSGTTIVKD